MVDFKVENAIVGGYANDYKTAPTENLNFFYRRLRWGSGFRYHSVEKPENFVKICFTSFFNDPFTFRQTKKAATSLICSFKGTLSEARINFH